MLIPMTGDNKEIGELIIKAARLAVLDINTNNLEIYPRDTSSNPDKTLRSAKELKDMGINIVIGPVFHKSLIYLDEIEDLGPYDSPIDSMNYFDTAFSTSFGDLTLYVGVNNVFDQEAPVLDDLAPNGNTFPSIYDAFGRYIFTNLTYQF